MQIRNDGPMLVLFTIRKMQVQSDSIESERFERCFLFRTATAHGLRELAE